MEAIEADYLVIGTGAMGMAFADEIIHGDKKATVVIADRRSAPGGHWNDAYPFVTLHQPAAFYGVNSEELSTGPRDLAGKGRILGYYRRVMRKLEATGRLRHLPMCDYAGGGLLVSRLAPGRSYQVKARRATVNAAYMNVEVPSTRGPAYQVDAGVNLVPINGLASVDRPWSRYVVIGGGKTGIDAILFLLARGVDPASVSWVVPNDAWFYDRENLQPRNVIDGGKEQLMAGLASESVEGFLTHLEARGRLLRLDREVWPTKYRCATVTKGELAHLRRVEDVIRMGRVRRISTEEIELVEGAVLTGADTLHVDCTADGLAKRPEVSIFAGAAITLQPAVMCQQVFSAALIAAVELRCADDGEKNKLLTPVPHPEYPEDALVGLAQTMLNLDGCGARMPLWLRGKRLSMIHHPGLCSFLSHAVYMKRHLKRGAEKLRILGQREG